jgi:hypothetical protein
MRTFSLVLTFIAVGVCFGAQREHRKEPTYQGKTLGEGTTLTKDKDPAVRIEATEALGKMGPAAIPALIDLLGDKDQHVRQEAAEALEKIKKAK